MEYKTSKNQLITNVLLVVFLFFIIFSGAYQFGKNLNKDIQYKKEVDRLKMENLKLEIELKKLELLYKK